MVVRRKSFDTVLRHNRARFRPRTAQHLHCKCNHCRQHSGSSSTMTMQPPSAEEWKAEQAMDDVSPLTSAAESDEDPVVQQSRDSMEMARYDRGILDEEEEREKLLTNDRNRQAIMGLDSRKDGRTVNTEKTGHRSKRRRKKRPSAYQDEEGELMYEMEEGGPRSETSSQASSSSTGLDKLNLQSRHTSRVSLGQSQN